MVKNKVYMVYCFFLMAITTVRTPGEEAEWKFFRGSLLRNGFSTERVGVPMGPARWIDTVGCEIVSSCCIAQGRLYTGARDGNLYAINAASGNILWKRYLGGWIDCSPAVHNKTVLVGSPDRTLWVINLENGDTIRSFPGGLQLSSPAIGPSDGVIVGLGAPYNGISVRFWNSIDREHRLELDRMSYSSPAVSGNRCVIATTDGKLYAVDLGTMSIQWQFKTFGGAFMATPAISDGVVYFAPGNYDRTVYAVDLSEGKSVWKSEEKRINYPAKRDGVKRINPNIFVKMLHLSPEDRAALLRIRFGVSMDPSNQNTGVRDMAATGYEGDTSFIAYGDSKTSSVAVGRKAVMVIRKELGYPKPRFSILSFDRSTGKELWRFSELRASVPEAFCSSPLIANNTVFFGWGEGRVYAMDEQTGRSRWQDSLSGDIVSSPAISNGMLYFTTINGYIYAYDLFETPKPLNFNDGTYCYPNPAHTRSFIQYFCDAPASVKVRIYDQGERLVQLFSRDNIPAGTKGKFEWQIDNTANGTYFAYVTVRYENGGNDKKILKLSVIH